jgi:hypothetical protein
VEGVERRTGVVAERPPHRVREQPCSLACQPRAVGRRWPRPTRTVDVYDAREWIGGSETRGSKGGTSRPYGLVMRARRGNLLSYPLWQ